MINSSDPHVESVRLVAYVKNNIPLRKTNPLLDKKEPYTRFIEKVCFGFSDCWYWRGSINRLGYGCLNGEKAHRASWRFHFGEIPDGKFVLHRCDVRNCVNPNHLFLGTQLDNVRDCIDKGRHRQPTPKRFEMHPLSKLTKQLVLQIRQEFGSGGVTQRSLAKKYGVGNMTICRVVNNKLWRF